LTLAPGQAGQGVGGLARLADGDGQCALGQGRVAIAELRGDLDVAGQARQLLERIAADLAGVEGGAAGDDLNPVDGGEVDLVGLGLAVHEVEVVAQGVLDAVRLLMDLLLHEVPVLALLDQGRRGRDLHHRAVRRGARGVEHARAVAVDGDEIAFFQIADLGRERADRQSVRAQVHLAVAPADHQRAATTGAQDQAVLALDQHRQRIGAGQPVQHALEGDQRVIGLGQFAVQQVGDHLGVGLALEGMAFRDQLGLQLGEILDDAVVDQRHPARLVRVGVGRGRCAVGGPAGVADADGGVQRLGGQHSLQLADLALGPAAFDLAVDQRGHPGGVIAPVFQSLQAVDQTGNRRADTRHANDAAHERTLGEIVVSALGAAAREGLSRP
jgi:hypothetical protein